MALGIHEAGHAIIGSFLGYDFRELTFFGIVVYKDDSKIKIKIDKNKINIANCIMIFPSRLNRRKYILYVLGGVLATLVVSLVLIIVSFLLPSNFLIISPIALFLMISIYPLIPIIWKNHGLSDGMQILITLKYKDSLCVISMMHSLTRNLSQGIRYSELDSEILNSVQNLHLPIYYKNALASYIAAIKYDMGEHMLSYHEVLTIDTTKSCYISIRNYVNLSLLYYYTIHEPHYNKAKEIYANKSFQLYLAKTISLDATSARVYSAYSYFIEGDKEKGKHFLMKTFEILESKAYEKVYGMKLMELDYCSKLHEIIKAEERLNE